MAEEESRKKWGTIFMGDREASVEQLNAMQEPLRRQREQREHADEYMERVRARAADRAREILGAAYAERQKVLEEAAKEARSIKRRVEEECAKLKSEAESFNHRAASELDKATAEREEAERIRASAHDEGFKSGAEEAETQFHELSSELAQSVAMVLHAIGRERKRIMDNWREDIAELARCAVQAGTGVVLAKDHEPILRELVYKSLDMLENHSMVTMRVNPVDEEVIGGMFKELHERFPDLRQWIVVGDEKIERGGLVAESGSGSVDLKRENFREMVDGVLCHLGLPERDGDRPDPDDLRDMVEREVAHITSLTPEMDIEPAAADSEVDEPEVTGAEIPEEEDGPGDKTEASPENMELELEEEPLDDQDAAPDMDQGSTPDMDDDVLSGEGFSENELESGQDAAEASVEEASPDTRAPSLEDLEDELFPVEEVADQPAQPPMAGDSAPGKSQPDEPDQRALSEGGFV